MMNSGVSFEVGFSGTGAVKTVLGSLLWESKDPPGFNTDVTLGRDGQGEVP